MISPHHLDSLGSIRGRSGSHPSALAKVEIHRTFADAEATWRTFEPEALSTPYQRYDWIEAWYRYIGRSRKLEPMIVVARNEAHRVVLLWPFVVGTVGASRVASWPGGKFSNYNMGLYDREAMPTLDKGALVPILKRLRDETGLDALSLKNQPEVWRGIPNPLFRLPHQPSPSHAYSLSLQPDFEAFYADLRSSSARKKLRRSERKVADRYGSCTLRRPESPEDVDRALDAFAQQKAERMREKSIPNVFDSPGVMGFFRELAVRSLNSEEPLIDLLWLGAGDKIAATWGGTSGDGRLCGIFTSFDAGELAQHHPGELLLRHLVEDSCQRGLIEFDLGVGEARYKRSWCPRADYLFDSFLPLTPAGWMHSSLAMTGSRLKRAAKQSKFLRDLTERLR